MKYDDCVVRTCIVCGSNGTESIREMICEECKKDIMWARRQRQREESKKKSFWKRRKEIIEGEAKNLIFWGF